MADISDFPLPPQTYPPNRPNKSQLRRTSTMITDSGMSRIDSISPASLINSSVEMYSIDDNCFSDESGISIQSNNSASSPREKSKSKSRFTERFERAVRDEEKKTGLTSIRTAFNKSPDTGSAISPKALKIMGLSSIDESSVINLHDAPYSTNYTSQKALPTIPIAPISPLQRQIINSSKASRFSGTMHITKPIVTSKENTPINRLNRAQYIIIRLESWRTFLVTITTRIKEILEINTRVSKSYRDIADSLDISKEYDNCNEISTNFATINLQENLHAFVMQIVKRQRDFSNDLQEKMSLIELESLRSEVEKKIDSLRNNPQLSTEGLLHRAEAARMEIEYLNTCCKQVEKAEEDPCIVNLSVLHHLNQKREEENRLKFLMIPIQKEAQAFEERVVQTVKSAIKSCCETLVLSSTGDKNTTPIKWIEEIMPNDWERFMEANRKDWVDKVDATEYQPNIDYPNRFNPLVMALMEGSMERKIGVRKQFATNYYMLSQAGYLHQFNTPDSVKPEKSYYIPHTTIIPPNNLELLLGQKNLKRSDSVASTKSRDSSSNTFEICRPATKLFQNDKIYVFRTPTGEEMAHWCKVLMRVARGDNVLPSQNTTVKNESMASQMNFHESNTSINSGDLHSLKAASHDQDRIDMDEKSISKKDSMPTEEAFSYDAIPSLYPVQSVLLNPNEYINEIQTDRKLVEDSKKESTAKFMSEKAVLITAPMAAELITTDSFIVANKSTLHTASIVANIYSSDTEETEDTYHPVIDDYISVETVEREDVDQSTYYDENPASVGSILTSSGITTTSHGDKQDLPRRQSKVYNEEQEVLPIVAKKVSPLLKSSEVGNTKPTLYQVSEPAPPSPSSGITVKDFKLPPVNIPATSNVFWGEDLATFLDPSFSDSLATISNSDKVNGSSSNFLQHFNF